jgi:diacylglycerol kinase family enzyme
MYLVAVIQTIMKDNDAPRMQVVTDQERWEEKLLLLTLCNGPREGGGFLIQPQARIDDGVFHYASISQVSRLMMFRLVPEVMKGTHGRFKQVRMGQFNKLSIESDRPLYIHMDGEIIAGFGVDMRQLEVEILPAALEVVS